MPTWNQIQSQLRNPNNPVVFFDISVGTTVSNSYRLGLHVIDVIEMTYNTYYGLNLAQGKDMVGRW
jgi:peptidyl-prolyl isomerase H (cyclophilin H)